MVTETGKERAPFPALLFEKQKTPPDSSNREEKVGEKILNCYIKEASRPFVYPHWANGIYWAILDPTNAH